MHGHGIDSNSIQILWGWKKGKQEDRHILFCLFVLQHLQFPLSLFLFIIDFLNANQTPALQEACSFF